MNRLIVYIITFGGVAVAMIVFDLINSAIARHSFLSSLKSKKTDFLMAILTNDPGLTRAQKKWLFNYITKKRKAMILKPTELKQRQMKVIPKGKHYVMRKTKMKK